MSVIVRDEEGKLLLFSKGADRFVILFIIFNSFCDLELDKLFDEAIPSNGLVISF